MADNGNGQDDIIIDVKLKTDDAINKLSNLGKKANSTASRMKLEMEDVFRKLNFKGKFNTTDAKQFSAEVEKMFRGLQQIAVEGKKSPQAIQIAFAEMARNVRQAMTQLDVASGFRTQMNRAMSDVLRQQKNILNQINQGQIKSMGKKYKNLQKSGFENLGTVADKNNVARSYELQKQALMAKEKLSAEAAKAIKMAQQTAKVNLKLEAQKIDTSRIRDQIEKELKRTTSGTQFKNLVNVLAFGQVTEQLKYASKGMIDAASKIEQYRNTLKVITKDPEKANKIFNFAQDYEQQTAFELPEVMRVVTQFTVMEKTLLKYNTSVEEATKMSGELAAAFNQPIEEAQGGLSRILTGDPNGLEILRSKFGISAEVLGRFGVSRGSNGFSLQSKDDIQKVLNAITQFTKETTGGNLAAEQSKTLGGMISTFNSQLFKTGAAIFEPLVPVFKDLVQEGIKLLKFIEGLPNFVKVAFGAIPLMLTGASMAGQTAASGRLLFQALGNAIGGNKGPGDVEEAVYKVLGRNGIRGSNKTAMASQFISEFSGNVAGSTASTTIAKGMAKAEIQIIEKAAEKSIGQLAGETTSVAVGTGVGSASKGIVAAIISGISSAIRGAGGLLKTLGLTFFSSIGGAFLSIIGQGATFLGPALAEGAVAIVGGLVTAVIALIGGTGWILNRMRQEDQGFKDYSGKLTNYYDGKDLSKETDLTRLRGQGGLRDLRTDKDFKARLEDKAFSDYLQNQVSRAEGYFGKESEQYKAAAVDLAKYKSMLEQVNEEKKKGVQYSQADLEQMSEFFDAYDRRGQGSPGWGVSSGLGEKFANERLAKNKNAYNNKMSDLVKQGMTYEEAAKAMAGQDEAKNLLSSQQAVDQFDERRRNQSNNQISGGFARRQAEGKTTIDDEIENLGMLKSTINTSTQEGLDALRKLETQQASLEYKKRQDARRTANDIIRLSKDEKQAKIGDLNQEMIEMKKTITDKVILSEYYATKRLAIEREYQMEVAKIQRESNKILNEGKTGQADINLSKAESAKANIEKNFAKLSISDQVAQQKELTDATAAYVKQLEAQAEVQKEADKFNTAQKIQGIRDQIKANPAMDAKVKAALLGQINAEEQALRDRNSQLDQGVKLKKEEIAQDELRRLQELGQQYSEAKYGQAGDELEIMRKRLEMVAEQDKLEEKGGFSYINNLKERFNIEKAQLALKLQNSLNDPKLDEAAKTNLQRQYQLDLIELQNKYLSLNKKTTEEIQAQIDKMAELKKKYYNDDGSSMGEVFGIDKLAENMQTDSEYFRAQSKFNDLTKNGKQTDSSFALGLGFDPEQTKRDLRDNSIGGGQVGEATKAELIRRVGPAKAQEIIDKMKNSAKSSKDYIRKVGKGLPGFSPEFKGGNLSPDSRRPGEGIVRIDFAPLVIDLKSDGKTIKTKEIHPKGPKNDKVPNGRKGMQ